MKGKTGHVHVFVINKDYIEVRKSGRQTFSVQKSGRENDNKKNSFSAEFILFGKTYASVSNYPTHLF